MGEEDGSYVPPEGDFVSSNPTLLITSCETETFLNLSFFICEMGQQFWPDSCVRVRAEG
jgi:hypothetical protein